MVGARVAKSIWSSRQSLPTHSGAVPAVDTNGHKLTHVHIAGPMDRPRNSRAKQATLAL